MNPTLAMGIPRPPLKIGAMGRLLFVVLHAPLCLALKLVPYLATLHAWASLAIVVMLVVRRFPSGWVVAGCAYLVGSETLWRMTHAGVFWEFGKYSLLLVVVTTFYLRRQRIKNYLPLVYLALLMPGAVLTLLVISDLDILRQTLSFDLSGPIAYAACSLFLFGRKLSRGDVLLSLTALLAPIAGVAALTVFGIETTDFTFGTSSLKATSGGYGANQVSAILGLGMLACFLLLASKTGSLSWRTLLMGLLLWFGVQSALTFSRSGLYYCAASMVAGSLFLVADLRKLISVLLLLAAVFGLGWLVVIPRLDAYTGGALLARFENKDLTGRDVLMKNDLNLFLANPVLGVGVGMGKASRGEARGELDDVDSHTEYTRLISEHGVFGAVALVLMLLMSVQAAFYQAPGWPKAVSASLVAFALVFMLGSGMRLAIPSFLLAFSGVRIMPQSRKFRASPPLRRAVFDARPASISRVFMKRR